jgi:hypothetical protein
MIQTHQNIRVRTVLLPEESVSGSFFRWREMIANAFFLVGVFHNV